jgi:hypothetical protein
VLDVTVGDQLPDGGVVVSEVCTDREGRPCAVDDPELATIEVTVRYPDGTEQRTYLTASS